jgi:hypothetical protein
MTSRELADAIDALIVLRIGESLMTDNTPERVSAALLEQIEVQKRTIADAFKRLDHTGGMYVVGKDACGKEQT